MGRGTEPLSVRLSPFTSSDKEAPAETEREACGAVGETGLGAVGASIQDPQARRLCPGAQRRDTRQRPGYGSEDHRAAGCTSFSAHYTTERVCLQKEIRGSTMLPHDLKWRPSQAIKPWLLAGASEQERDPSQLTSKEVCLSQAHSGYLLVNMFIIVFPFQLIQNKKKTRQWSRKECTILS